MRILHLIADLSAGGAEMTLYRLLSYLDAREFPAEVVSLTGDAPLGEKIRALGVPVTGLEMKPGLPDPRLVTRVREQILRFRPDLIQTWMYHADLVGGIAAKLSGNPVVIWNIRHTLVRSSDVKRSTLFVARANAFLSRSIPARIICCADAALESHAALGYAREKMSVIPNGFDLEAFRPDPVARGEVRATLGVDDSIPLIGMCGRFDLQKDHHNFLAAAGLLRALLPDAQFVLWGKGVDLENPHLSAWIAEEGLGQAVHLLGFRTDSPRLNAALDVATLSAAYGEAFPNVVGEAMACAVPCVVTGVGDAAYIVGETGRVVPPGSPEALAAAWAELLSLPAAERKALGTAARKRVENLFSLEKMGAAYAQLYRDIIGDADGADS
jgi:glycosyltransferase involved in cell wall biosynthesis